MEPGRGAGLIVIRVWSEDRGQADLRARVTQVMDLERGDTVATTATSVEDVTALVREFLRSYLARVDDGRMTEA